MNIPALVAIRFLDSSEGHANTIPHENQQAADEDSETQTVTGDKKHDKNVMWVEMMERKLEQADELFLEELDELFGSVAPAEAAARRAAREIEGRLHLREVQQGVRRLELSLMNESHFLPLLPQPMLEQAVLEEKIHLFRMYRGGFRSDEWVGDPRTIYAVEKARRIEVFQKEWQGRSSTSHFLEILSLIWSHCKAGDFASERILKMENYKQRISLMELLDDTLSDAEFKDVRMRIEAAGLRWKEWCRAGRSLRDRVGLEKIYF